MNGTQAVLAIKPHLTPESAATEAYKLLRTTEVKSELARLNSKAEESAIRTRAEIINNMARLSEKAEKSKSYTPAINAMKEVGILSGAYEKEGDDSVKYTTFIESLTVNVGARPQDVVSDSDNVQSVEAEWEDALENQ